MNDAPIDEVMGNNGGRYGARNEASEQFDTVNREQVRAYVTASRCVPI